MYRWLREVCSTKLLQTPIVLGGRGVIVQIDESLFRHKVKVSIPTNPQTNFCLSFVEKLLDMGTFLLENAAFLSKMYGHYISQVITKMWELVIFVRDQHHFCLISSKKLDGW